MLSLEEKRAALQAELDGLDAKLGDLKKRLVGGSAKVSAAASAPAPAPRKAAAPAKASAPKPAARAGRPGRSGRGELKNQIFAALEKAGASGAKVLDLAQSFGTKPANIYAWFHAALKRYPNIKKIDGGTYRLAGKAPAAAAPAKPAAPAKTKVKASAKASKSPATKSGRAQRGSVSESILEALKSAGASGINIKTLSEKLGSPYRNLQVWFATTGKKHKNIKKIKPATYRLA